MGENLLISPRDTKNGEEVESQEPTAHAHR